MVSGVRERLGVLVGRILDGGVCPSTLRPEVLEMAELLEGCGGGAFERRELIGEGESVTGEGLAVSPTMAAMCAGEFVRTVVFLRGLRKAIGAVGCEVVGRPVRVLYVGCGPLGTLAVPLMCVMEVGEVEFVMLDVHGESVASVREVVGELGLGGFVREVREGDAMEYEIPSSEEPDVLVMEIMQAVLAKEMQVPVTRRLVEQVPGVVLVPEEVRVELVFTDVGREFDLTGEGLSRRRMEPLEVFTLSKERVEEWRGVQGGVLPGRRVRMPRVEAGMVGQLFTTIEVFGGEVLRDYDTGLTSPRMWPERVEEGVVWEFEYELGEVPGLRWGVFC